MRQYAADTDVSTDKSKAEIEKLLVSYGDGSAVLMFRIHGKMIRFRLVMPKIEEFRYTEVRRFERTKAQMQNEWDQACRARWRALFLVIKAKFVAIDEEITTIEDEFLANIVLPDNSTAGDFLKPQIESAYQSGRMPLALPGIGETER